MLLRFSTILGAGLPLLASLVSAVDLDPDSDASIKAATRQYAFGLMSYYKGNESGLSKEDIGVFPKPPYYWWEAGAAWGGMIEYTRFTDDTSYVGTLHQALVTNYGPDNNILLDWKRDQEGNDDQAFWALSLMSALEYQFPAPSSAPASYLEVTINAFNNMVSRWDTTSCNGGFKWQIYPDNPANGYNYKNAISNGAIFALGARLARYTGNETYSDWATKIWDWSHAVGLVGEKYEVFDGTDDKTNCTSMNHMEWSYNIGMYMHGAAVMYNTTSDSTWKKHVSGFLDHAGSKFFKPFKNATDIMFEPLCETGETGRICNVDQFSFKAYLSRFLAKTAIMVPGEKKRIEKWLRASAVAAAKACTGGEDGTTCGHQWYTGKWDGTDGVGQQMNALEVTQALLTLKYGIAPGTGDQPEPQPSAPSSSATIASSTSTLNPSSTLSPAFSTFSTAFNTSTSTPSTNTQPLSAQTPTPLAPASPTPIFSNSTTTQNPSTTSPPANKDVGGNQTSACNCTTSTTLTTLAPPPAVVTVNVTVPEQAPPPGTTSGDEIFAGEGSIKRTSVLVLGLAVGFAVFL